MGMCSSTGREVDPSGAWAEELVLCLQMSASSAHYIYITYVKAGVVTSISLLLQSQPFVVTTGRLLQCSIPVLYRKIKEKKL